MRKPNKLDHQQELPHLEKDIWKQFKDKNLTVISIGREHTNIEMDYIER